MKRHIVRPSLIAFALSLAFTQSYAAPVVLPTGSSVVAGSAEISTPSSSLMEIRTAGNAIINWQSFSIGQGATVSFIQQSAQNSVLNRVLGNLPSTIDGLLQSNGKVFLINPAGIVVGASGRIDVAGFVGSTLNMTDANFQAGKFKFDATPNAGAINNLGRIAAPSGGQILLVAPEVTNIGTIVAPNGSAVLAAGQTVELFDTALPGLKVEITGDGTATNLGNILASAGRVGMVGALVNNSGTLNTTNIVRKGGQVFLVATKSINLSDSSVIRADGVQGGEISVKVEAAGESTGELSARGQMLARGNSVAGSGGSVETSANVANIDALKVNTAGGSWQLSLDSVDINDSTSSVAGASTLRSANIASALLNNNLVIKTKANENGATGDLWVNSGFESTSPYSLTLSADRDIAINRSFAAGVIAMTAGGTIGMPNADASQVVTAKTSLQLTAANGVDLKARTPLLLASAITNSGNFKVLLNEGKPQTLNVAGVTNPKGNISIENYGGMNIVGKSVATDGDLYLQTHSPLTIGAPLSASQAIFLTAGAAGSTALDDILTINALVTAPRIVGSANSITGTNIPTGPGFTANIFAQPNPNTPGSTTPSVNTDNLLSSTINNNRTPNQPYSSGGRSGPGDNFDQLINQMPTAAGPGEFGERPAMTLLSGTIGNTPGHFGGDSDDELDMSYQNGGQSHFGASGRLQQCL